jgi:O-antigen/teichoic acid export membrane protein
VTFINLVSANFINEIARTSLISLDRILIPIFSGSISQLTYYSVPGNLAARVPGTADNLSGILFPTSTSLYISGKTDALKNLYMRSTRLIMLLSLSISFGMILNAEKIMRYWLDESFAKNSTNILIILIITNLIFALLSPIASFLMGINKMKFNTLISVSMALLNIIALIILLPRFGIAGAAWAYLMSVLPIFFAMYFIEKRYLQLQGRIKYYVYFLIKTLVTTLISGTIVLFIFIDLITNFLTLAIFGPLSVILYLAVFIALGFLEKEDYNDIKNFVLLKLKIK